MKSKTVASNSRMSSQNRRTENRIPIAAVVAWYRAGATVMASASMW